MKKLFRDQNGANLAIFAISLTVAVGMAALSIDVGMMLTAKNQLQSSIDAAALAAASGLQVSQNEAMARAMIVTQQDTLIDQPLELEEEDFSFIGIDKVQVSVTRPVNLVFSQLFGLQNLQVSASATAEMGARDIMLAFDRSGSMDDDTRDPRVPQPITDTKEAAKFFVNKIRDNEYTVDQLGLISYSTDALLDVNLGRSFSRIRQKINRFQADGYTNIGEALNIANQELLNSERRTFKYVILLSDGMANRPGRGTPTNPTAIQYAKEKADFAADNNIKIYTISLGNRTDRNLMEYIANKTGGQHYYSPTTAELQAIFDDIATKIPARLIS